MKNYRDKDWLREKYWVERLPITRIAKLEKCSTETIHRWMKKFNIVRRKRGFQGGKNHWNWKGGTRIWSNGYVLILKPSHPCSNKHGYVRRSRLVMEKHLGRYLDPKEIPHHKNEIRDDDRIENLRLFASNGEHISFHKRIKQSAKELCI